MSLPAVPVVQLEVPLGQVSDSLDRLSQERGELRVVVDGDGATVGVDRLQAHRRRSEGHAEQLLKLDQVLVVLPEILLRQLVSSLSGCEVYQN